MTTHVRIDWWNIGFTVVFAALSCIGYGIVVRTHGVPHTISLGDAVIIVLATFRLTRLAVYDSITAWARDMVAHGKPFTLVGTLKTLANCPWCMGLWFGLVTVTAYYALAFAWFFLLVLALGGVASLVQIFANWLGWHAEYHKIKSINEQR